MGLLSYISIFVITIITMISVPLMLPYMVGLMFVLQIYFILFMLIIAGIALYLASKEYRIGWFIFTLFFLAILIDITYAYYVLKKGGLLVFSVVLIASLGFVVSLSHAGRRKRHRRRSVQHFDVEPEKTASVKTKSTKKANKKSTKKSSKKKKTKKTATKKKSKKTKKSAKRAG